MVSKIIIEKYGRRMIKGNNPNWKPSRTEPTKEEMLERLEEVIKWFPRYQSPALQERRDEIDDAIRSLIENQPEVDEEFIKKWVKQWMQDDADFLRRELLKMLQATGIKIKEASDE